jgi:DNA-binding MarR family transcriptional regulator
MGYMAEGRNGLIDDQLSGLLLDFFNRINNLQLQTHSTNPIDTLSQKEIQVIETLAERKVSMNALSKLTGVKSSTLTQITDKLVKKQHMTRISSEKDRRVVMVHLTSKGLHVWKRQIEVKKKVIDGILSTLHFEEQVALMNALIKIKAL